MQKSGSTVVRKRTGVYVQPGVQYSPPIAFTSLGCGSLLICAPPALFDCSLSALFLALFYALLFLVLVLVL